MARPTTQTRTPHKVGSYIACPTFEAPIYWKPLIEILEETTPEKASKELRALYYDKVQCLFKDDKETIIKLNEFGVGLNQLSIIIKLIDEAGEKKAQINNIRFKGLDDNIIKLIDTIELDHVKTERRGK